MAIKCDLGKKRVIIKRKLKRKKNLIIVLKKHRRVRALRVSTIRVTKPRISPSEGLAILIGTQIGAGVLGLPYAASQVGLIPAVAVLAGITLLMLFTSLIVLRVSADMGGAQMSALTYKILGGIGGWAMYISIIVMGFGALLAYIAGMGSVFSALFGVSDTVGAIIFWIFASVVIYMGLEASGKAELILSFIMLILFVGVIAFIAPYFNINNALYTNYEGLFAIMGVAIFSLGCHTVIPDVYKGIGDYKTTKKVVILAFLIPALIYGVFMAAFLLVFGTSTPQIATQGLKQLYGGTGAMVGNIIPFLAITTSYIGIGLAGQSNTVDFLHVRKPIAWAITVLPPLLVYLAGVRNFADVLAFAGDTGDMTAFIILPILILVVEWYRKRRMQR